jgi:hypothetical protein
MQGESTLVHHLCAMSMRKLSAAVPADAEQDDVGGVVRHLQEEELR